MPLYGESAQCFTLEHPGLKLCQMQDKTSLVLVAFEGGCSWSKIEYYRMWCDEHVVWFPHKILCSTIVSDACNIPKYLCRELNFFESRLELTLVVSGFRDKENRMRLGLFYYFNFLKGL